MLFDSYIQRQKTHSAIFLGKCFANDDPPQCGRGFLFGWQKARAGRCDKGVGWQGESALWRVLLLLKLGSHG